MTWISYQCFTLAPRRVFCFSRVPYGTAGLHGVFFNLWSQGHITIMIVLTASTAPVRRWTHSLAVNVIISESRVGTGRESDELWISPSGHPRPESCPLASKKKKKWRKRGKKALSVPRGRWRGTELGRSFLENASSVPGDSDNPNDPPPFIFI